MEQIGIRELKARASELVRAVKERRARYIITRRGEPVAVLLPVDAAPPPPDSPHPPFTPSYALVPLQ